MPYKYIIFSLILVGLLVSFLVYKKVTHEPGDISVQDRTFLATLG